MAVVVLPAPSIAQSYEGFYSINNQFQESGPKGCTEFKFLENGDFFCRIDMPGIANESSDLTVVLHPSKRFLAVVGRAPSLDIRDSDGRMYGGPIEIFCSCCEFSGCVSHVSDGVLRLVLSKTPITPGATCPLRFPYRSNPHDPIHTGPELQPQPWLKRGPTMAYEATQLVDGSLYVRVDMPGVPADRFTVSVTNGRVRVSGQAPAVTHDSAGRFYSGDVAVLSHPCCFPFCRIGRITANYGVIRLEIFPPI